MIDLPLSTARKKEKEKPASSNDIKYCLFPFFQENEGGRNNPTCAFLQNEK